MYVWDKEKSIYVDLECANKEKNNSNVTFRSLAIAKSVDDSSLIIISGQIFK